MAYAMRATLVTIGILLGTGAWAEPKVNVENAASGQGDTSIVIKKGDVNALIQCVEYQIIDGSEDLSGEPALVKNVAQKSWKVACNDWKKETKELNSNAKNVVLAINCGSSGAVQEGENWVYRSHGTYKLKVKIREKL